MENGASLLKKLGIIFLCIGTLGVLGSLILCFIVPSLWLFSIIFGSVLAVFLIVGIICMIIYTTKKGKKEKRGWKGRGQGQFYRQGKACQKQHKHLEKHVFRVKRAYKKVNHGKIYQPRYGFRSWRRGADGNFDGRFVGRDLLRFCACMQTFHRERTQIFNRPDF